MPLIEICLAPMEKSNLHRLHSNIKAQNCPQLFPPFPRNFPIEKTGHFPPDVPKIEHETSNIQAASLHSPENERPCSLRGRFPLPVRNLEKAAPEPGAAFENPIVYADHTSAAVMMAIL